jgi:hypothetical protein
VGNDAGTTSWKNEESQKSPLSRNTPPPLIKFVFNNPLTKLAKNVAKGTGDLLDNLNPLKLIFPKHVTSTTAMTTTTTSRTATTTQKSTPAVRSDPVGGLLLGAKNMFDAVLGGKRPTTALPKTTVAPPAGGHGRGFPALMFNSENIIQKILEIVGAIVHWFDHSEPSYLISRIQSLLQSLDALKDIYVQRDMDGGIGEIPKHIGETLKNIKSLADSVLKSKSINIGKLLVSGQGLFQDINKLKDDFIEPVSTTPIPGGWIGNVLHGLQGLTDLAKPHDTSKTNKKTNHTNVQQMTGEFGKVVNNTRTLIHTLGEIEEIIQSHHPKSILLQFVGKIKDLAELCLTNDTLDNENILDVLQKVSFPNTTLSKIIQNVGKILQQDFPKIDILQGIGTLLQQKMLVDLGLNICVRSLDFLRFGNIKHSLLQAFANIENIILGKDLNRLLAGGIGIFDKLAETFEWLLKTFHSIVDPLFSNIKL